MYLQRNEILEILNSDNGLIDDGLIIRPLLDKDEQVGEMSIDLRIGTDFLVSFRGRDPFIDASHSNNQSRPIRSFFDSSRKKFGHSLLLHPSQTVLCSSLEYIKLPNDVFATLSMRSSLSRLGLTISTILQPGYCGCASIELTNTNTIPIQLTVGMRFVQARLYRISEPTNYNHSDRKYVGQVRPISSKICEDKDFEILSHLSKNI